MIFVSAVSHVLSKHAPLTHAHDELLLSNWHASSIYASTHLFFSTHPLPFVVHLLKNDEHSKSVLYVVGAISHPNN